MNDTNEIWRPVIGYEGLFEVSNLGRIRSLDWVGRRSPTTWRKRKGKIFNPNRDNIHLRATLRGRTFLIHVLVAEAFIGPRPPGLEICHNNGNGHDNRVERIFGTTLGLLTPETPSHTDATIWLRGLTASGDTSSAQKTRG